MTIPIATSPGRSGFGPQLSLSYDSGAGNGPFGLGWNLSLPSITRKTDKGLPRYRDAEESDVFILSGAEDLVPTLVEQSTGWIEEPVPNRTLGPDRYRIKRYRPRTEGLFARIERWSHLTQPNEVFWRSISKDNISTWYGRTAASRIADPADPARIFSWLICETRDDKGNAIIYDYAAEDDRHVDSTQAHEAHRQAVPGSRSANRYLKRICYGNRTSHLLDPGLANPQWMFQVVFDYGEGHLLESPPDPAGNVFAAATTTGTMAWPGRADPFSTYRAGFEVRTYRLCQRVLMFHHFAELAAESGPDGCLVRSTEFRHRAGPVATYLDAVTHSGYAWDQVAGKYLKRSLPPVAFTYSAVPTPVELAAMPVCELDRASLENLPVGLDGGSYQWIDLDGEGISGVLTQQAGAWYYKANLGAGRLGALQPVATLPATAAHGTGHQLLDLAGDGQLDVVNLSGPTPGFFERTPDERWENFKAFRQLPHLDWHDPNLRFIDLDGDGHADILITEHDVFTWYPSLAEEGFAPARQVHLPTDEAQGPRLVFADGTQSMLLADMSGDGLTDLVRIRNGEICYWPNLGYGQFGPKVTMDHAPWFDSPDVFDHRRIRTADIDGSGVTDLLYLAADGIRLYYNQAGNRWSAPQLLPQFPPPDNLTTVNTVDLFGTGTACLVWSSPLPAHGSRPLCYIDLMGGQKPHLLIQTANNLGAKTKVHYSSSTKFYLQDKAAGKPWITRLSFPVHVVEKVETCDLISGNRFTTRYAYHHGYFDGTEREFRGFGLVEQWDTEEFTTLTGGGPPSAATNLDHSSHVPPVLTRTWFHTGIYLGRERVSDYFAGRSGSADRGEYYREPGWLDDPVEAQKHLLPDTVLPAGLSLDEEREACRALRGAMLRQEIYALDGPGSADYPYGHPYTVTEQNFTVRRVQPHQDNRYAVFFTHPCEALSIQYERNPTDPRTSHALTLAVDAFGNVLKSLAVGYGRRAGPTDPILTPTDKLKQSRRLIILTENRFTNGVADLDAHRTPLPAESRTFELTGFAPAGGALRFRFDEWTLNNFALSAAAAEIRYEQTAHHTSPQRRLIEHIRSLYRKNDLTTLLPTGVLESLALTGESYQLAFTPELLTVVYQRNGQPLLPTNPGDILQGTGGDRGGYILSAGSWWRPSGRGYFDPAANHANAAQTAAQELATARQGFFLPRKITDPFGQSTTVVFDTHHLFPIRTSDALGNTATAAYSYRTLQPELITDPNGNRTAAAFDALGLVVATAVLGRAAPAPVEGDLLAGFEANPTLAQLQSFLANPAAQSAALLGSATTRIVYDLERFRRCGQSPFAATLARETHGSDLDLGAGQKTKIQFSFSYSDGFGREIQKKIQAEPGDAPKRTAPRNEPSGDIAPGTLVLVNNQPDPAPADPRWVGTGRTVFNNKGQPVRQYEPFFSATHLYEPERELTDTGVSPILFYDPVGRVVATLNPNHTYGKVVFDPWKQTTHDVNDTVTLNPAADPDVAGFFRHRDGTPRIPTTDYTPTWYAERLALPAGDPERVAAEKAAAHANTPSVAHLDALGRPILTVAHNKVACPNHTLDGRVDKFCTRVELDIEGNQRAVLDAQDRIVMRYDYDLLGHRIHQASMEAGERWMLNDVTGKPIRAWNSRGHTFRSQYDALRRPVRSFVTGADPARPAAELLTDRLVYGEQHPDRVARQLRGKLHLHFDQAGVVANERHDFKGNLREASRRIAHEYKQTIDWTPIDAALPSSPITPFDPVVLETAVALRMEMGRHPSFSSFDALNRPLSLTTPDQSIYRPTFNEANLLNQVDVNLRGAQDATAQPVWTPFVTNIDYDAKGQRTQIDYGNRARTIYGYDELTFRLIHLKTTRPAGLNGDSSQIFADTAVVQDLHYTYDPAGNITRLADAALLTVNYNGQTVDPACAYTYDATYRLIEARGREHIGQSAFDFNPSGDDRRDYPFKGHRHANDLQALRNFIQRYNYDAVGNFDALHHVGHWTRQYTYAEASLLEPGKLSNRLSKTIVGTNPEDYTYADNAGTDVQGCMTAMSNRKMRWDYRDQLQQVDLGGGGTAWYVYDSSGQRTRKVIADQNGKRRKERVYLGGFEIYREFDPVDDTKVSLARETLHVMDDKQRIALVETQTRTGGQPVAQPDPVLRYQLGNHLGSGSVELDRNGSLISYEEYHPYGTAAFQTQRSGAELSLKRFRYTGKERDEESGFCYHGARYYAPWLGRWASCDPAGLVDGANLFAYVADNPLRHVDPSGTAKKPPKLNDTVVYKDKIDNRSALGANVQKDHVIAQSKQRIINPKIDRKNQLTVAVETGAAKGSASAKPHTQVTFHDVQSDVAENKRLKKLKPEDWTSFEQEVISPSLESRYRAGYPKSKTNVALLDEVGSAFEVEQPNRKPNTPGIELDWTAKTDVKGPKIDTKTGLVEGAKKIMSSIAESETFEKIAKSKTLKVIAVVAPILMSGIAKAAPGVGTVVGAADVVNEAQTGGGRRAALTAIGMSEIPYVSQTADLGLAIEDAGWAAKDVIDPEGKAEDWAHANLEFLGF